MKNGALAGVPEYRVMRLHKTEPVYMIADRSLDLPALLLPKGQKIKKAPKGI
jgi:hypothetical protein